MEEKQVCRIMEEKQDAQRLSYLLKRSSLKHLPKKKNLKNCITLETTKMLRKFLSCLAVGRTLSPCSRRQDCRPVTGGGWEIKERISFILLLQENCFPRLISQCYL